MSDEDIAVTKDWPRLTAEWPDTSSEAACVAAVYESMVRRVLEKFNQVIEARLDELIANGYRGTMFAWMTMPSAGILRDLTMPGRANVEVHTSITEPEHHELMTQVQRYHIDDGIADCIAEAWVKLKAARS
jgi:hypothetical protein